MFYYPLTSDNFSNLVIKIQTLGDFCCTGRPRNMNVLIALDASFKANDWELNNPPLWCSARHYFYKELKTAMLWDDETVPDASCIRHLHIWTMLTLHTRLLKNLLLVYHKLIAVLRTALIVQTTPTTEAFSCALIRPAALINKNVFDTHVSLNALAIKIKRL